MTTDKATHMGTCQICGALQKLPGGRLAAHGYTVQFGYFQGTCGGSGQLPFEQSTKHLEHAMACNRMRVDEIHILLRDLPQMADGIRLRITAERQSRESWLVYSSTRLEGWTVKPLQPVEEVEEKAATVRKTVQGIRALARARDDAKYALRKLVDRWSREYLVHVDALGAAKGQGGRVARDNTVNMAFYYSPEPAHVVKFIERFRASNVEAPIIEGMRPLCDDILEARRLADAAIAEWKKGAGK